jgi:hypothetical protein
MVEEGDNGKGDNKEKKKLVRINYKKKKIKITKGW